MIHMKRAKLEAPPLGEPRQEIEEDDGIDAAAQAQQQPIAGFDDGVQPIADMREEVG